MNSLFLLILMSSKVAVVTTGAVSAKQTEIAAKLTDSAKDKLDAVAKTSPASESEATAAVKLAFPNTTLSDADLTTLSFYVMANAASSLDGDIKTISHENEKMKKQKTDVEKSLQVKSGPATMSKVKALGPHDYFRAPSALPSGTPPPKLLERLSDLGAMSDANQSKIAELTSQKSRFESTLSIMLVKVNPTDWTSLQSLK